jgi:hypothetical protein
MSAPAGERHHDEVHPTVQSHASPAQSTAPLAQSLGPIGPATTTQRDGRPHQIDQTGRTVYVLIQGSAKISAQCDLAAVFEMMCLLNQCGTRKDNVRAFLSPMKGGPPYPSSHLSQPPFEIPPTYKDYVNTDRTNLSWLAKPWPTSSVTTMLTQSFYST